MLRKKSFQALILAVLLTLTLILSGCATKAPSPSASEAPPSVPEAPTSASEAPSSASEAPPSASEASPSASDSSSLDLIYDANGNISFATKLEDVVQDRSNCSGHVGMVLAFMDDITVTSLGRYFMEGNNQVHTLRIMDEDHTVLGSVDVDMATGTTDTLGFICADLESPVTLKAGAYYYFFSSEIEGGDRWYGDTTLTELNPSVAIDGFIWGANILRPDLTDPYYVSPSKGCYGPVNFYYTKAGSEPSVGYGEKIYSKVLADENAVSDWTLSGSISFDNGGLHITGSGRAVSSSFSSKDGLAIVIEFMYADANPNDKATAVMGLANAEGLSDGFDPRLVVNGNSFQVWQEGAFDGNHFFSFDSNLAGGQFSEKFTTEILITEKVVWFTVYDKDGNIFWKKTTSNALNFDDFTIFLEEPSNDGQSVFTKVEVYKLPGDSAETKPD